MRGAQVAPAAQAPQAAQGMPAGYERTQPLNLGPAHTLQVGEVTTRCAVSADGALALSTSHGPSAHVWDMRTGHIAAPSLPHHPHPRVVGCALADLPARVAATTAHSAAVVYVWALGGQTSPLPHQTALFGAPRPWPGQQTPLHSHAIAPVWVLTRRNMSSAGDCALSADGRTLLATFQRGLSGEIVRCVDTPGHGWHEMAAWTLPNNAAPHTVSLSKNGAIAAIVGSVSYNSGQGKYYSVSAINANSGNLITSWNTSRAGVAIDARGIRLVIAEEHTLRVVIISGPVGPQRGSAASEHSGTVLQGYCGPSDCSISGDGSIVVAARDQRFLGIWNTTSGLLLANLCGHTDMVRGVAISSDGAAAVSCSLDKTVRVWNLKPLVNTGQRDHQIVPQQQQPQPKLRLIRALHHILKNPESNSVELLLQVIRKEHVRSVDDLVCGHNIVLLAIRMNIITRKNYAELGGVPFYLNENLYFAIVKNLLTSNADKHLAKHVLLHAEKLGIITDGYSAVQAWEIVEATQQDLTKANDLIANLAKRVSDLESRVDNVEQETKEVSNTLGDHNKAIGDLASSLSALEHALKREERIHRIAAVAKIGLAFIPFAAGFGAAASAVVELAAGYGSSSNALADVGRIHGTLSNRTSIVDLSNGVTALGRFSEQALSNMDRSTALDVQKAVRDSSFGNLDNVRRALNLHLTHAKTDDGGCSYFLDIGESEWLKESSSVATRVSGRRTQSALSHEPARETFARALRGNGNSLTYRAAEFEISKLLDQDGIGAHFSAGDIATAISDADVNHSDRVDVDVFIRAIESLSSRVPIPNYRLSRLWKDRFEHAAGSCDEDITYNQARRIILEIARSGRGYAAGHSEAIGVNTRDETVERYLAQKGISAQDRVHFAQYLETANLVMSHEESLVQCPHIPIR
jgi:WD40 repeat protein